jgi:hypothetical protein
MRGDQELRRRILSDLCSGMHDTALMEKYGLSYGELRSLYKDLFDTGLLTPARISTFAKNNDSPNDRISDHRHASTGKALHSSASLFRSATESAKDRRRRHRYHTTTIQIPVYDRDKPEIHGLIREINETGARLAGLEAEVGDVRTIVALGDTTGEIAPFEFQARCRWTETSAADGRQVTGFEITDISDENLHQLRKLIDAAVWGG